MGKCWLVWPCGLLLLCLAACGPTAHRASADAADACAGPSPPPGCNITCDANAPIDPCPGGTHCSPAGVCSAVCTAAGGCGAGESCTPDGRCIRVDVDATQLPDADCPDVTLRATFVPPTLQLLIDNSGSMNNELSGPTSRFEAVHDALVGGSGIVTRYQSRVYFGATRYHRDVQACPALSRASSGRVLNNLGPIRTLMERLPEHDNGTPTGPALRAALADLQASPAPAGSAPYIVLATDGQPYTCPDNEDNAAGQQQSRAAAAAAHAAGIPVIVLGVAVSSDTRAHLRQVANLGRGLPENASPGAPYYQADNPAQLASALETILRGVISCDLQLDAAIQPDHAAQGSVILNGMPLTFGSDWMIVGDRTIRLIGAACDTLRTAPNSVATATFPCGTVVD